MRWVRRATAVLILIAAGFLAVSVMFAVGPPKPAYKTVARIVRFGSGASKFHPGRLVVVAVDADGVQGEKWIEDSSFECQVGDTIPATRQGVALTLDLAPCLNGGRGLR